MLYYFIGDNYDNMAEKENSSLDEMEKNTGQEVLMLNLNNLSDWLAKGLGTC